MRIDRIDVCHVSMPLKEAWKTSFSEEWSIDSVLVRVESEGIEGWGEAAPYAMPQFCSEWAAGATQLVRDVFAPVLIGRDIASGQALQKALSPFKGNQFAKAAIDTAWWDLEARRRDTPLWRMIGGKSPEVMIGADIPVQASIDKLLADVAVAVAAGFPRTKLKFRPDSGVAMVAAVREAFPQMDLHIDCNCGFTLDDLPMFRDLDRLGLKMIEQPLAGDDLIDHARLQEHLETPICLDESITSLHRARKAVELGAARWINIKHGRVGGLTNALEIHAYCVERQIPCWIGGMLELNVGQGFSVALATLPGNAYAPDIFPRDRLYATDLASPEMPLSGPCSVRAPDRPGQGFRPDPGRLEAWQVEGAT